MPLPRLRRAFTLIELLAVIAIIALLSTLVLGLRPENPKGLQGATNRVQSLLSLARSQAMLSAINDPEDTEGTNKYATVRTRLLILKDKNDPENHLRLMGIVYGAQVNETTPLTESAGPNLKSKLKWYAAGEPSKLPDGIYYAENRLPKLREVLSSDAQDLTFANAPTMKLAYPRRKQQLESGSDSREWYYYEFLADGSCNMRDTQSAADTKGTAGTGARLMFVEADLPPGADQPTPKGKDVVGGVIITPRGAMLPVTQLYEQKAN